MIRWVFLDVGNVVMNDDPVMAFIYGQLYEAMRLLGVPKSYPELLEERERALHETGAGHWYLVGQRYLGEDGMHSLMHQCAGRIRANYMAYHNVLPGIPETLARLSQEFSLGILANQLRESADALEATGLRRYFRVLAMSEMLDLKKPDAAIFEWALREAGCAPAEAIMVGDRIDNDIVPARLAGMWTIWFHMPLEQKGYVPADGLARLYFESQMRASVAEIGPARPEEVPDGEATSGPELVSEILRLSELSRQPVCRG